MLSFTGRQWLILFTVQFCTVLFGVTITSVGVILPQLKGALSATQDQVSWILTFNLVTTAVVTPLTGWLAAKLGWRTLMLCSVIGFTGASVLCGAATSLEMLLLFRVIQGGMGAPIFPMGQAMLLASFRRDQHAMILMMWGIGGVMGPILGPTFGGLVAEWLNWRWAFFLILPLGAASALMVAVALRDQEKGTARRFDGLGYLFIAIAIAAAQLMFDRGQRNDWFDSVEIVIEAVLAATCLYLFVTHSLTSKSPLFSPALFTDRNFVLGIGFATIMGMLQYTPMVLFPPMLQDLRGYPDAIVGYLIATRGVGNFLSFFVVVQCTRASPRMTLAAGLAIQAAAALWMGALDINLTTYDVLATNLIHGFGFGLAYTPMAVLTFSTLQPSLLTQGNALFSLLRMLGSSIFISLTLLVFVYSQATASSALGSFVSIFYPTAMVDWAAQVGAPGSTALHLKLASEVRRQAAMIGYINAFHLLTLMAAATAPFAMLFSVPRPEPAAAPAE
ncbi:MAG: DHA2 family efflux MFS transporter permease subunit [Alphaproteobacteria bacterium]